MHRQSTIGFEGASCLSQGLLSVLLMEVVAKVTGWLSNFTNCKYPAAQRPWHTQSSRPDHAQRPAIEQSTSFVREDLSPGKPTVRGEQHRISQTVRISGYGYGCKSDL
jgi:hypothetical protein